MSTSSGHDAPTTLDRVVEELRRALFDGELAAGTALREVALAASLGVSRPTLREALGVLVAEGLADRVAHRGTVVRKLDAEAITDLCRARLVLESAGVRAWPAASAAARAVVLDALEEFAGLPADATAAATTAAHLRIHRGIVGLAGSERLLLAADGLYAELRLALATVDRQRRDHDEQVVSHRCLVDLLESGDTNATLAELAAHLENARGSLLSTL